MSSLAETLNGLNCVPSVDQGNVTLQRYADDDTDYQNPVDLSPMELQSLGFQRAYVDAHPEGSDRGGYVPYVVCLRNNELSKAHYDELGDFWVS